MNSFVRPSFSLPLGTDDFQDPHAHMRTIYDVLQQSATANPDHPYAIQHTSRTLDLALAHTVTHCDLLTAVDRCSAWLVHNKLASRFAGGSSSRGPPVAIFLSSDLNILIHVLALLKLGNPVALFSARLSAIALQHLIASIGVHHILTTASTWATIADELPPDFSTPTTNILPLALYLSPSAKELDCLPIPEKGDESQHHNDMSVFAWHSSGSTGLPKPVFHTHRFWHCYLACYDFDEDQDQVHRKQALNMPPLYHGFGMLPMALAISVGFTVVLPPPSTIPTAQLVLDLLSKPSATPPQMLFTVPSLLTDMLTHSPEDAQRALNILRQLELVTFAGAPIKPSTGDTLARAGVRLLNHYGATETGSLAPIRFPPPGYEWRWLILRRDMGLEFQPMPGTDPALGYWQLSSRPFGWKERFYLADAMVAREVPAPSSAGTSMTRTEYMIAGRVDNVIVLATGEKISPSLLESALTDLPQVEDAIVFGSGRFQIGVLIELAPASPSSENGDEDDETRRRERQERLLNTFIWPALLQANRAADAHAQIERDLIILTTSRPSSSSTDGFVRTAKGTPARAATLEKFEAQIARAYERLEEGRDEDLLASAVGGDGAMQVLDLESGGAEKLERQLERVVRASLSAASTGTASTMSREAKERVLIGPEDDFFEVLGMDSLKAARLLRILNAQLRRQHSARGQSIASEKARSLPQEFVYQNCTIRRLAAALRAHVNSISTQSKSGHNEMNASSIARRTSDVRELVQQVSGEMDAWAGSSEVQIQASQGRSQGGADAGATVLLTGSTGGLGAWLVHSLLTRPRTDVARVVCLVRHSGAASGEATEDANLAARNRQLAALDSKGVPRLSSEQLERLTVLATTDLSAPELGLIPSLRPDASFKTSYADLVRSVTHIVHNAWSVDFLRPLHSFGGQVRATARLLLLAEQIAQRRRQIAKTAAAVRFVFSSTIAVVGRAYALPLDHASDAISAISDESMGRVVREVPMQDAGATVPMGYALAKLACEQLIAHRQQQATKNGTGDFLATSIRIGQLTGAEGTGNWSASEHMALIVASSAQVGCLPRLEGGVSWIPTNRAAEVYTEVLLSADGVREVVHLENPERTKWEEVLRVFADELSVEEASASGSNGALKSISPPGAPIELDTNGSAADTSGPTSGRLSIDPSPVGSRRGSHVLSEDDLPAGGSSKPIASDGTRKRQRTKDIASEGLFKTSTRNELTSGVMTPASAIDGQTLHPTPIVIDPNARGEHHYLAATSLTPLLDSLQTPPWTPAPGSVVASGGDALSRQSSTRSGQEVGGKISLIQTTQHEAHHRPKRAPLPIVDFERWLELIRTSGGANDEGKSASMQPPARKLLSFLEGDFVPIATGRVVLDMAKTKQLSRTLRESQAIEERHIQEYVGYWRQAGLL
ncbi:hypothetical protein V8E36_007724 [Tilletia maclaganii]